MLLLNHRPAFQKGIAHFQKGIAHFLSRPGGGSIVFDSSVHQIIPKPTYLGYACSKAAIGHMTSTLALEYAGKISAHPQLHKAAILCKLPAEKQIYCHLCPPASHKPLHTNLSTQTSPLASHWSPTQPLSHACAHHTARSHSAGRAPTCLYPTRRGRHCRAGHPRQLGWTRGQSAPVATCS